MCRLPGSGSLRTRGPLRTALATPTQPDLKVLELVFEDTADPDEDGAPGVDDVRELVRFVTECLARLAATRGLPWRIRAIYGGGDCRARRARRGSVGRSCGDPAAESGRDAEPLFWRMAIDCQPLTGLLAGI